MSDQTLNIPSLLLVVVILFLTLRYFFFAPSSRRAPTRGGGPDPVHVEQIASMFPQLGRREIMWDLQRNGGSVAATTERVLSGRGLDVVCHPPPGLLHRSKFGPTKGWVASIGNGRKKTIALAQERRTFFIQKRNMKRSALIFLQFYISQPPPSFQPPLPQPPASAGQSPNAPQKPTHPDLITRYNLASRLSSPDTTKEETGAEVGKWAQNRQERQALLQRRREEMILNARRKLEEEEERARARGT